MRRSIAYFTDSDKFGGAERYLLQIFQELDPTRWHISLYYHDNHGIAPLIEKASSIGVILHPVPLMPLGVEGARQALSFSRALREDQLDIFHANLTWPLSCKYGMAGAVMARVPAILATLHTFPQIRFGWPTRLQQRLLGQWIDRYIVVSRAMGKQLHQAFWIPKSRIRVIYNGIPAHRSPTFSQKQALSINNNHPVVFTAARLDRQKGLDYLVQAAALVPQATFLVAGEGPEHEALQVQVSSLGLQDRFYFLGFQTDIESWLARADLFVLPSLFEGLSLSVLEAMAAGKPVVASYIEGMDEVIIADETGLLVPPADPQALAQAIRLLLADPVRADAMGRSGKDRVQRHFRLEKMVVRLLDTYDEVLTGRGVALAQG
jgi:glycosyltransferase involved in cell wall biosynthesis